MVVSAIGSVAPVASVELATPGELFAGALLSSLPQLTITADARRATPAMANRLVRKWGCPFEGFCVDPFPRDTPTKRHALRAREAGDIRVRAPSPPTLV